MLGNEFWKVIKNEGYPIFSGVPDSSFGNAYMQIVNDPDVHFVPAIREDVPRVKYSPETIRDIFRTSILSN